MGVMVGGNDCGNVEKKVETRTCWGCISEVSRE